MGEDGLRRDVEFLAGRLPHRGANTDNERAAAEYLLERFKEHTEHAELDEFHSINSAYFVFASYYIEFLIVSLLAFWSPWLGLGYGLAVFTCYMAEFTGYNLLSRLLPQFETQNVVARFYAPEPKRTIVVTANYDSPKTGLLARGAWVRRLRAIHTGLLLCMITVLVSCAAAGFGLAGPSDLPVNVWVRWTAAGILAVAAFALYRNENQNEPGRGAVDNASGVAVLAELAARLDGAPLHYSDVWLVATGSKQTWCSGMRHLLRGLGLDRDSAYFVNLVRPGAGAPCFLKGEGMQHVFRAAPKLLRIARKLAAEHGASEKVYHGLPTDALIPLARGYKALSIMGMGEDNWPPLSGEEFNDNVPGVDFAAAERATGFAEALLRNLDDSEEGR